MLNTSGLKKQSINISLTYKDSNSGKAFHHCYFADIVEGESNFPLSKGVSSKKMEDISLLTPALIGVSSMIACIGILACITFTTWGLQLKNDNKKLKMKLNISLRKQTHNGRGITNMKSSYEENTHFNL